MFDVPLTRYNVSLELKINGMIVIHANVLDVLFGTASCNQLANRGSHGIAKGPWMLLEAELMKF